jgi:WD40 repeat protein
MRTLRLYVLPPVCVALFLTARPAPAQLKPVGTVTLPCESHYQGISPAGDQLYVRCTDRSVQLVKFATGATLRTLPADLRILGAAYSDDGRHIAIARWDGTVELFASPDPAEPTVFKTTTRPDPCAFSPNSAHILLAPANGPGEIWDLRGVPRQIATLPEEFGGVTACAFSPDGKLLVTAHGDTVIRYWDTGTWHLLHEYRGCKLETFAISFTPDGSHVLLGGAEDHITKLDLDASQPQSIEKEAGVVAEIAFLGASPQAIIRYYDGEGRAPPHASIWSLETGKATPLPSGEHFTGGGVVHGNLWLFAAKGKTLNILEYR